MLWNIGLPISRKIMRGKCNGRLPRCLSCGPLSELAAASLDVKVALGQVWVPPRMAAVEKVECSFSNTDHDIITPA
jgi:hypothetical protein